MTEQNLGKRKNRIALSWHSASISRGLNWCSLFMYARKKTALGRTWKEVKVKSGMSHDVGHIWKWRAFLSLLVTSGLRKSNGSETSLELFFFKKKKKVSHRMESLGHRCKPLGPASSVSLVLVSRTKREREKRSFALKTDLPLQAEGWLWTQSLSGPGVGRESWRQ